MNELFRTGSEDETRRVGGELAARVAPHGALLLYGDLGVGKTVLAQGVGEALGIARAEVQSPTFSIVHEYHGSGGTLLHVDLYRLDAEEVLAVGIEETLDRPALKVVEWADRLPFEVPAGLVVRLRRLESGEHELEVASPGPLRHG